MTALLPAVLSYSLSYNRIGDQGAMALADVLAENPTFLILNMGRNRLTDEQRVGCCKLIKEQARPAALVPPLVCNVWR